MSRLLKTAATIAALAVALPAAAQETELGAFDPARAGTLAERLVLCDLARYLETSPNLYADRVYVRRDNSEQFELRLPPYISVGGDFYNEDLERAFSRYRAAGRVTTREVAAAQASYSRPMTRAFQRANLREQRVLGENREFCRSLARESRRL